MPKKIQWHNVTPSDFLIISKIFILRLRIVGVTDKFFLIIPTTVFLFSLRIVLSVVRIDWKECITSFCQNLSGAFIQHTEAPRSETLTIRNK